MSADKPLTRRHLLTFSASAPLATALGTHTTEAYAAPKKVPRRILGKTKQSIPILLVGGGAGFKGGIDARIKLALEYGVDYIDTARKYAAGASERNAAATLQRLNALESTWITSKTGKWSAPGLEQDVAFSLMTMKRPFVDLYFLHGLDELAPLNDKQLIKAAERLKQQKKIRFFGFSCHGGNVVELLHAAASRPFIDAVMFRYSFRDYGNQELNRAIDAAHRAGVGLIAMKTQGSEAGFRDAWKKFEGSGKWTKHQAVLKAVWADRRITAAVSHMEDTSQLKQNLAAALDESPLGQRDSDALRRYAALTRPYACEGCDHLCGAALQAPAHIGTTLRCLMYHDSYHDPYKALEVFHRLPPEARKLEGIDFSAAERACPHGVRIGTHMRRAAELFRTS